MNARAKLAGIALLTAILAGCGGGSSQKGGQAIFGFVFGTHEVGLVGVAAGGDLTNGSGRFAGTTEGRVLIVGGTPGHSSLSVPLDTTQGGLRLRRPLFLPPNESGMQFSVVSGAPVTQVFASDNLPGVTLHVPAGAQSTATAVTLLPMASDLMPAALPNATATRCAYLLSPHDLVFSQEATLTLPNLDGLSLGEVADLYQLFPERGGFVRIGTASVDLGEQTLTAIAAIETGGIYALAPRATPTSTRLTGRITSPSGTPVEGYSVVLPGSLLGISDVDGRFTVDGVPVDDGLVFCRVLSAPGFGDEYKSFGPFAPVPGGTTDVGDLEVLAAPRDAISPTVIFSPLDNATNVNENTKITMTFSEAIDLSSFGMELVFARGEVEGAISFSGDGRVVTFQPLDPLENDESYTILIDLSTSDKSGNPIDKEESFAKFKTRSTAGTPTTAIELFGLDKLQVLGGASLTLVGQNFTGANFVTIGGTTATTVTQTQTTIVALVPLTLGAGSHAVRVDGQGNLQVLVEPNLLSIEPALGSQGGGDTVRLAGHSFGSNPSVFFNGNAGTVISVSQDSLTAIVPASTRSGPVVVVAGGVRSRDRHFFTRGP